jgi:cyclic pyranopterin phosphate synthase
MDQAVSSVRAAGSSSLLTDRYGRDISYLRVSVTDRCNLRCFYCMRQDVMFLPKAEVLSLEEMERLCLAFVRLGIRKLRLTGGEPLARPGLMGLVARLGKALNGGGLDELTLTTNGVLLARHAEELAAAGVRRVNVSLDTLDAATFRRITRHDGLGHVLQGIVAARAAGLSVRINTVALAGINDADYDNMLKWCGEHGCDMALIEVMPLGTLGSMGAEYFLPLDRVRAHLAERWTLIPSMERTSGPSRYVTVAETGRRLGFITPLSHGFCGSCNRVRLTCTGSLVPCLARDQGIDLRGVLRASDDDGPVEAAIVAAIADKPAAHCFGGGATVLARSRPMWQLGG